MQADGKSLYPSSILFWLNKITKKLGLTKETVHSLRHTNISLQIKFVVDLLTVAARSGHSIPMLIMENGHSFRSANADAANKSN